MDNRTIANAINTGDGLLRIMVIEGIITTENSDGSLHVAPIGPHVNEDLTQWVLKPFQSSTTFANLRKSNRGVFHVTDDALLMTQAVLGLLSTSKNSNTLLDPQEAVFDVEYGWMLPNCCRAFALKILDWDIEQPRAHAFCQMSMQKELRAFWGWNRAAHSILELCILASRRHMISASQIESELEKHQIVIEKTAGSRERSAWELLKQHLSQ